ncbi:MAG: hypothetical protein R3B82_10905 [Sandaracinaceae bacterium]
MDPARGRLLLKLDARLIAERRLPRRGCADDRQGIVDYADVQVGFYGECGVTPRLTVLAFGVPFGYAVAGGRDTAYVGPLGAGLRFDPLGDGGATRLGFELDYAYAPAVGDAILFEEPDATPRVFYRAALENHYGELSMQIGHGFGISDDVSGWVNGAVGVRLNSAVGTSPALTARLQVGFTFWRWFQTEVYFPLYEPFFGDLVETNIAGVGQTRYLGFGIRLSAWMVDWLSVFASLDGVFWASSNAATPSVRVGLESRFSTMQ